MTKFVLVGGYAGKTINLGGHLFKDGVFDYSVLVDGDGNQFTPSPQDVALKADFLAKSYQAYPEGSKELEEALAALEGGEAPSNGKLDVGQREAEQQAQAGEQQAGSRQKAGAIRTALSQLDPKNDEHWTQAGLPSVEAVRSLSGDDEVSRGDIQNLAPKLTREEAAKVAGNDPLDN